MNGEGDATGCCVKLHKAQDSSSPTSLSSKKAPAQNVDSAEAEKPVYTQPSALTKTSRHESG